MAGASAASWTPSVITGKSAANSMVEEVRKQRGRESLFRMQFTGISCSNNSVSVRSPAALRRFEPSHDRALIQQAERDGNDEQIDQHAESPESADRILR